MTEQPKRGRGIAGGLTNYGDPDFAAYLRRSFARSMGYSNEALDRPIVGIANTYSGFNNCHRRFPELLDAVKRGVLMAGGLPLEFPTISLGEVFLKPTSLKFRNLMAMDTEEMIRAQPIDAVVLMGGCDKTVPAQLMAAVSANVPTVQLVGGPMSTGRHRGERLGACTDCRRFWARYRAGDIGLGEIEAVEGKLATTAGTCAVMGTASTMACLAEALGVALPRSAVIGAPLVLKEPLIGGGPLDDRAARSKRSEYRDQTAVRIDRIAAGVNDRAVDLLDGRCGSIFRSSY
jgi:dihydroxy-acid dehydratase